MTNSWDHARYHLDFEMAGEQPVLSIHTHPDNLSGAQSRVEDLKILRSHLSLPRPFSFDGEGYGFDSTSAIQTSRLVAGWSALQLAVPKACQATHRWDNPVPDLLPLVSTAGVVFAHLNRVEDAALEDADHPQYIEVSLSNSAGPYQDDGAAIRARLTPYMLKAIGTSNDNQPAEARVTDAMINVHGYARGIKRIHSFRTDLADPLRVSFDYPGDGARFAATNPGSPMIEGLKLNAANCDEPLQQVIILAGLAILNQYALNTKR